MAATETTFGDRIDARRNRERLVAAARELFASAGVAVATRDVAREAGVGVATLYRHFPTREDLVDAVLEDSFEEFVAVAEAALADPDPWRGFTSFLEEAIALYARNRGFQDVIETQVHGRERTDAFRKRIRPLVAQLVARAQEEGTLRRDFAPQDVTLLFWASDRAIDLGSTVAPEIWRRQLGFMLDGLRAANATPLSRPALTDAQLKRIGK